MAHAPLYTLRTQLLYVHTTVLYPLHNGIRTFQASFEIILLIYLRFNYRYISQSETCDKKEMRAPGNIHPFIHAACSFLMP